MGDKTVMCIGGNKMKKLFFGTLLLALVIVVPIPTMAGVDVGVGVFSATAHRICRTTRDDSAA